MGNNTSTRKGDDDNHVVSNSGGGMHTNMMTRIKTKTPNGAFIRMLRDDIFKMRMANDDVFQKYEVVDVLGTGGMGIVTRVKIRDDYNINTTGHNHPVKEFFEHIPERIPIKAQAAPPFLVKKKSSNDDDKTDTTTKTTEQSSLFDRESPVYYALKSIKKGDCDTDKQLEGLRNEIEILSHLDHPNIARAYEVFENKHQIYMVLELCDGGDLYAKAPYSESESCSIVNQLLSAIKYMHARGVVHRDLKFQNILWEHEGLDAQIKLIDFGLSKKFGNIDHHQQLVSKELTMMSGVGTISTMAPEVLDVLIEKQGAYTKHSDLWSVGVITYMLLSSQRPFEGKSLKEVVANIRAANYTFGDEDDQGNIWNSISDEAKDFVTKLLNPNPLERLDASQALEHPWFSQSTKFELPNARHPPVELRRDVKKKLEAYKNASKMKKIALNVIAYRSTNKEILELREVFNDYDKEKNGMIKLDEFQEALRMNSSGKFSDEDVEEIFNGIDITGNGNIQYTEFLGATLECRNVIEGERIAEAFDQLDADNTGYISKENLLKFLGDDASALDVEELFDEFDTKKDGRISYNEFKQMFNHKTMASVRLVRGNSTVGITA